MKYLFLLPAFFIYSHSVFAQKLSSASNKLNKLVKEKYQVLATNKTVKQGLYQALYKGHTAVASGQYINNKKTGMWHFYDRDGKLIENYDYTAGKLLYEAPEDTGLNRHYHFDQQLKPGDHYTPPIRIGGRYFGYLPYLAAFKLPPEIKELYYKNVISADLELLISPLGRLANCKIIVHQPGSIIFWGKNLTYYISLDLFSEEDKTFIPATINGVPVMSRVVIDCYTDNNSINMY